MIAAEDRNGNKTTLTYDSGTGRLASVADPAGRGSLTFSYDGSGRIASIADWASPARSVQYGYDTAADSGRSGTARTT